MEEKGTEKEYKVEFLGEKYSKDLKSYKVILLGDAGVGKTSIVYQIKTSKFLPDMASTISIDLVNYQVKVNEKIIQIQFWDTCGNDEFAANTPQLFKDVSLLIIVYAINDRKTFNNIEKWYNIMRKQNLVSVIYLIGNKSDLKEEGKTDEKGGNVDKEEGEKLKKEYNFNYFFETSSKTGLNMKEFIKTMAISLFEKKEKGEDYEKRIILKKEDLKKNKRKRKKRC